MKLESSWYLFGRKICDIDSVKIIQIFWWTLSTLLITILFKCYYLNNFYFEGIHEVLVGHVDSASRVRSLFFYFLFFSRDYVEVVISVATIYLVGNRLVRIKTWVLAALSIGFSLAFTLMNWFSVDQIKTFASYDTLIVSLSWIGDNPELINSYIRKRNAVLLALGLAWCLLPLFFGFFSKTKSIVRIHKGACLAALVLFVFSSVLCLGYGVFSQFKTPFAFQGYWSSSIISFFSANIRNPFNVEFGSPEQIMSEYKKLVFTNFSTDEPLTRILTKDQLRKRHVIIIGLETAPLKYYKLYDNPVLPGFGKFTNNGIVSTNHFSVSPFTSLAYYSILTGTYPPSFGVGVQYGDFRTDGISNTLSEIGYLSTYVDSHQIDWLSSNPNTRILNNLGFKEHLDNSDIFKNRTGPWRDSTFEEKEAMEKLSFERAKEQILKAIQSDTKAFVFVATIFGHYSWVPRPGFEQADEVVKLEQIIASLDRMMADFHRFLVDNELEDEVVVVITGDHGVRYRREFAALNEKMTNINLSFQVPFVLYCPGLFEERITPDYATSHVDIAPTVLNMLGVSTSNRLLHGTNMLERNFKERSIYLLNTGLRPVNYLMKNNDYLSFNYLTQEAYYSHDSGGSGLKKISGKVPLSDLGMLSTATVNEAFSSANTFFDQTGAYFFSRGKR